MPNLTDELGTVEERRLNQFGSAGYVYVIFKRERFEVNGFTVLEAVTFRRSGKTDENEDYKINLCISE